MNYIPKEIEENFGNKLKKSQKSNLIDQKYKNHESLERDLQRRIKESGTGEEVKNKLMK